MRSRAPQHPGAPPQGSTLAIARVAGSDNSASNRRSQVAEVTRRSRPRDDATDRAPISAVAEARAWDRALAFAAVGQGAEQVGCRDHAIEISGLQGGHGCARPEKGGGGGGGGFGWPFCGGLGAGWVWTPLARDPATADAFGLRDWLSVEGRLRQHPDREAVGRV